MAYTATVKNRVLRELKSGASLNDVSKKYKIATTTLSNWRNAAGYTRTASTASRTRVGRKALLRKSTAKKTLASART